MEGAGGSRDGYFEVSNGIVDKVAGNLPGQLISEAHPIKSGWQGATGSVIETVPGRIIIIIDNNSLEVGCIFAPHMKDSIDGVSMAYRSIVEDLRIRVSPRRNSVMLSIYHPITIVTLSIQFTSDAFLEA